MMAAARDACDVCGADVEPLGTIGSQSGWYGGYRIIWQEGVYGSIPEVVEMLCQEHKAERRSPFQIVERPEGE